MRTRLLLATLCMLILPMWYSSTSGIKSNNPAPFATAALAGHTLAGGYCDCGAPGCLCDPGEVPGGSARPVSDDSPARKTKPGRVSDPDVGTGAFLIALAFFMWIRFRG